MGRARAFIYVPLKCSRCRQRCDSDAPTICTVAETCAEWWPGRQLARGVWFLTGGEGSELRIFLSGFGFQRDFLS